MIRKKSAPTPDSDANPWIDQVSFALNKANSNDEANFRKSSERPVSRNKKDIPRLDLTKLFSRRKSSRTADAMSLPLVPDAGTVETGDESPQQAWHQITNPWGIRIRKAKSTMASDLLDPNFNGLDVDDGGFPSPKIHVRKPPPGIKHWFDGVDDGDSASLWSDPEGRPSLSSDASLPRRYRDTFLSISTGRSPSPASTALSTPVNDESPPAKLETFTLTGRSTRRRIDTGTVSPTDPFTKSRLVPKRSHSSLSTIRMLNGRAQHRTSTPPRQRQLPDSIHNGESVLVLSETEDSDGDDDAASGSQYQDCVEGISPASPNGVPRSTPQTTHRERLRHVDVLPQRPVRIPEVVSPTSIEERSQISDDHSPRTSLLSDLRTISFRSEYRPFSFKTGDRPISVRTSQMAESYNEDNDAWLTSPTATTSQATSPIALLSEPFLPMSHAESTQPDPPAASKAHRIMIVTDEEARLLASIRRKRAEMRKARVCDHDTLSVNAPAHIPHSSPSLGHARRPSTANPAGTGSTKAPSTSLVAHTKVETPVPHHKSAHLEDVLRCRAPLDRHCELPRPSSSTVERIWQDVQGWRKTAPSPNTTRPKRPSLFNIHTEPPALPPGVRATYLSPTSSSPKRRLPPTQRMKSDGAIETRLRSTRLDVVSGRASRRRSQSLGEKLARRDGTDVTADVLAAWGDLGGWRRSAMMCSSPVGSPIS